MLDTVACTGLSGSALSVTVAFWPALTLLTSISATEVLTTRPFRFVMVMNPELPLLLLEVAALELAEPWPPWPLPLLLDDCDVAEEPLEDCCPTAPLMAVTVPAPGAY